MTPEILKKEILQKVKEYYHAVHEAKEPFVPGESYIKYGGRFFDDKEIVNLVDSALDFWLTSGPWSQKFELELADFLGVKFASLVNSGSSANLIAFMALTSPRLREKAIKKGDEVITVAAGFPTTIAPIIQFGAVPVFVDVDIPSYNIDVKRLKEALSPKTKAVMIAHTMGNPFNLQAVKRFCDKNGLWLIEDNCDALGGEYLIEGKWQQTGTIGDIGTSSFYPPHHMTMGEGGAVYTSNAILKKIINSFRDWGRDCWCESGVDNTCGSRFTRQLGDLPKGYDHKYVYSHFGFNLKATDMQAAIGVAQLDKLPLIVEKRRINWQRLHNGLKDFEDYLILPKAEKDSKPSWFGFLISVKEQAPFSRSELTLFLEDNKIQTRLLFAGNIIKQPAFNEMRNDGEGFRVIGELKNTNFIMANSFWLGVYPGMTNVKIDYMISKIGEFVKLKKKQ